MINPQKLSYKRLLLPHRYLQSRNRQSSSLLKYLTLHTMKIPSPTREMREVNLPEPDKPFNPEKREEGCKTWHPKSVQQGPPTAIGVSDLRSKQGDFQHPSDTAQPQCQARSGCSASGHRTGWVSEPDTAGACGPPQAASAMRCPFPPVGFPCSATSGLARPGNCAARTIFLVFKSLVGKSV